MTEVTSLSPPMIKVGPVEEEKTYIQDEQEHKEKEEEEKDSGISPSVLDVQKYFDSPDPGEEAGNEGLGPGNESEEGEEDKKGREDEPEEEPLEEPEEPEEEQPKDDEDEIFQDRRDRKIYTEEELYSLEEEEPEEEEPELLIDEEDELKKKKIREAKERRADKIREYNRMHGQTAQETSSGATGIEHEGTTSTEDALSHGERIRGSYDSHKAGTEETAEPAGAGDELVIEEGDTFIAQDISGAEGITAESKGPGEGLSRGERIRSAYGSHKAGAEETAEPAGAGDELVIEEGDTFIGPSSRSSYADAGAKQKGHIPRGRPCPPGRKTFLTLTAATGQCALIPGTTGEQSCSARKEQKKPKRGTLSRQAKTPGPSVQRRNTPQPEA